MPVRNSSTAYITMSDTYISLSFLHAYIHPSNVNLVLGTIFVRCFLISATTNILIHSRCETRNNLSLLMHTMSLFPIILFSCCCFQGMFWYNYYALDVLKERAKKISNGNTRLD